MKLQIKRVYDEPSGEDGTRVLVDRLWPRGLSKDKARVDHWIKDVSPSHELRRRFHGHPERWDEFRDDYFRELDGNPGAVERLSAIAREGTVTLLYASKDERHNNARALKEYVEGVAS